MVRLQYFEKVNQKMVANMSSFVHGLPQNSPYRRDLLKNIAEGVDSETVKEVFKISTTTLKRI